MSYTVESESYGRVRRRRRTAITLSVLILILAGTWYYASSYWNSPRSSSASAPICTPSGTGQVAPSQVTVNVYNATKRSGLAASVAKTLRERGFKVASVANDPAKRQITQPAEVRYGPAGERAAQLMLSTVSGAVAKSDTRADASVDLVLGDTFQTLAPAPTATASGPTASC